MTEKRSLRIAFVHPDLGIGGAERLVVDAALGLQQRGHTVEIYTSHHDPDHCFDETRDGRLTVHNVVPPFPRAIRGKFHILFAHLRQLHLTANLLRPNALQYDVFFVDQLSTCVPFLRALGNTRVVFYCHFPDKLLANGEFVGGKLQKKNMGLLKTLYRVPMDWWEEITTRQSDVILSNSNFTAGVFQSYFPSITKTPQTVYPGINIAAYESAVDDSHPDIVALRSTRRTLVSLNRFEKKKNAALAVKAFAKVKSSTSPGSQFRLVLAGGYDPRLEENLLTLNSLIDLVRSSSLTFDVITPSSSSVSVPPFNMTKSKPDVLFLLNFTTRQRTYLLRSSSTVAMLYTPANEHFGIGPVEGMICGVPVLACDSGGPVESVVDPSFRSSHEPGKATDETRTGWLRRPDLDLWAEALQEIIALTPEDRDALAERARTRAREMFGMEAMAERLESAIEEAVDMGSIRSQGAFQTWVGLIGFLLAYFLASWVM